MVDMSGHGGFEIVTADAVVPVYPVRSRADVEKLLTRHSGPFGLSCMSTGRRAAAPSTAEAWEGIVETAVRAGIGIIALGEDAGEQAAAREGYATHGAYVSPALVPSLLRIIKRGSSVQGPLESLTTRERDVLDLVALGLSNRAVGSRLFLSEHTVRNHLSRIFRKLGVTTRSEAADLYRASPR